MTPPARISIGIPSYRRGRILADTIERLLRLDPPAAEIVVVDQTLRHAPAAARDLGRLRDAGRFRWIRVPRPSIPAAMNRALAEAREPIVLFLDDDLVPDARLVGEHARCHAGTGADLVAGRVIQPWTLPGETGPESAWAHEFMGGNFSVRRDVALRLGGFDENFVRVAYRFEAEFAARLVASGGRIRFEPAAVVTHLKAPRGGTRVYGEHLRTLSPSHAVGEYYYLLRARPRGWARGVLRRLVGSVRTRHHARAPWWIPGTLFAETVGLLWGVGLSRRRFPGALRPDGRVGQ